MISSASLGRDSHTSHGKTSARTCRNARRASSTSARWARNRHLSRLLHGTRGQPVREFVGDRRLRGLPHEGDRALCRPRVSHADHSGDAYFEFVYWHEWPNTLNELAKYRPRALKAGRYDVTKAEKGAD